MLNVDHQLSSERRYEQNGLKNLQTRNDVSNIIKTWIIRWFSWMETSIRRIKAAEAAEASVQRDKL